MKYINNIFYGTLPATPGGGFKTGAYASDIVANGATTNFTNCNFYNIQGGMPPGFVSAAVNSISTDPLFKNAAGNDFHLLSGSPGINSGKTIEYVKTDFDSISRPQGPAYDMGAFELQTVTSVPNIPSGESFISIYPNPSSGILYISTKEPGCKFSVHDMAGNLIWNHTSASAIVEMKLENLSVGMYILRAQNRRRQDAVKFLVLK
ncbi:MAG: T9SS type A sorting domain-containing protein [Bacteroidetes bacterium]|nr:T9SS type A sorting domain-containing protein [Bacteroidota bacterium]